MKKDLPVLSALTGILGGSMKKAMCICYNSL